MRNRIYNPIRTGKFVLPWQARFTIRSKLISMMLIVTTVVLALVCSALFTYQWFGYRQQMVKDLSALTSTVADNSIAALAFYDFGDAKKILESLQSKESIEYAAIYTSSGDLLAEYRRKMRPSEPDTLDQVPNNGYIFNNNKLKFQKQISVENNLLGSIYVQSDLSNLDAYLLQSVLTLLALIIVVFIVAYYLSNRMQEMISEPILNIIDTVKKVSNGDLSTRININSNDEIGVLVSGLNFMTSQLQEMVEDLQQALKDMSVTRQALEASEERYRALYDYNPTVIITVDSEKHILSVNGNGAKILGYAADDLISKPITEFCYSKDADRLLANLNKCFSDHKSIHEWETRKQRGDGSILWLRETASIMKASDGNPAVLLVCEDISERKKAEESKLRLQNQLDHAQRMEAIGQLTGGIAHDFNNILVAILGYAELAENKITEVDDEELSEYVHQVINGANRAAKLVKELLIYGRGGSEVPKSVSAEKSILDTVRLLKASMPSSIQLRTDIGEKIPLILIDPTQLTQVIMNLCINARDAMSEVGNIDVFLREVQLMPPVIGMPFESLDTRLNRIDVCCCNGPHTGKYVELSVLDSGCGISKKNLNRIFEPFFSTKEVGKGTGMGLSVLHGVMQNVNGHIIVESRKKAGTVFRLLFKALESEQSQERGEEVLPDSPGLTTRKEACRVLLVDDEEIVLRFVRQALEENGYDVYDYSDAIESLEAFTKSPSEFDIVITDQTMPNLTGDKLAKKLLDVRPDIPIILCTGYSSLVDELSAKKVGISAFAAKPIRLHELLSIVNRTLADATSKIPLEKEYTP